MMYLQKKILNKPSDEIKVFSNNEIFEYIEIFETSNL